VVSWTHGAGLAPQAYLGADSLYTGFQLTIRGVVYPQMAKVPEPVWVDYEAAHQRRVSVVVGPLFAVLVFASGFLMVWH